MLYDLFTGEETRVWIRQKLWKLLAGTKRVKASTLAQQHMAQETGTHQKRGDILVSMKTLKLNKNIESLQIFKQNIQPRESLFSMQRKCPPTSFRMKKKEKKRIAFPASSLAGSPPMDLLSWGFVLLSGVRGQSLSLCMSKAQLQPMRNSISLCPHCTPPKLSWLHTHLCSTRP